MTPAHALLLLPLLALAGVAHAQVQSAPTEAGALIVELSTDPPSPDPGPVSLGINFVNPTTAQTQVHIDYSMEVTIGPHTYGQVELSHTAEGRVSIPLVLEDEGVYDVTVTASGIFFQPIAPQSAAFKIAVGDAEAPAEPGPSAGDGAPDGGGCLIATAAYGTEMAPQIQRLREIRDGVVENTESGRAFMGWFNGAYYSFSPAVADLERENPHFRGAVLLAIAPMVATLGLLDGAQIGGEADMLGYGVGLILLNLGIYAGVPLATVFGALRLRARRA